MRRYDHLADVEAFVATAEQGALSRAAAALGTSPSMISRAIARLEQRLGAQLLRRTTRRMSLTEAGRQYLERAQAAFALFAEAEREVQGQDGPLAGTVRISAPTSYGHYRLPERLRGFRDAHPGVELTIEIGNRNVDLIAEGFDLAIRGGELPDSGLVAHRLEDAAFCLVASPDYLRRRGAPADIAALATHAGIAFVLPSTGRVMAWRLREDGRDVDWMPTRRCAWPTTCSASSRWRAPAWASARPTASSPRPTWRPGDWSKCCPRPPDAPVRSRCCIRRTGDCRRRRAR
jgi:DNA-binding transcriptional LysR family regulator